MPNAVGYPARTVRRMRRQRTNQEKENPKKPHAQSEESTACAAEGRFAAAGSEESGNRKGLSNFVNHRLRLGVQGAAVANASDLTAQRRQHGERHKKFP